MALLTQDRRGATGNRFKDTVLYLEIAKDILKIKWKDMKDSVGRTYEP
jgi:hypothetical protein